MLLVHNKTSYFEVHNIVLLTMGTMLVGWQISRIYSSSTNETLYPLNNNSYLSCLGLVIIS